VFFEETGDGILLRIRLTPNASARRINGLFKADGVAFLKISVINVPEKGKANKELISFLASMFKVPGKNIEIISGQLDRYKKVTIKGLNAKTLMDAVGGFV
jgi:uncharacterized protein (TIGR00251 family)